MPSKNLPEYRPEGYRIAELGPVSLEGKGIDEMQDEKQKIMTRFQGCPFSYLQETRKIPFKPKHPHRLGPRGDGVTNPKYDSETGHLAKKIVNKFN